MKSVQGLFVVTVLVMTAGGCGQRPPLVPVAGVVVHGTAPVPGASVCFLSDVPGGLPAAGKTDAAGRFHLKTYWRPSKKELDGAAVGAYRVIISRHSWPDPGDTLDRATKVLKMPVPSNDLPERFNSESTSGLVADVRSGSANDFTFVLE